MPNRTELEEIVVRFAADAADYLNVLKQAKDQTKDSATMMQEEGKRLADSLKSPMEKYTDQLDKIKELYAKDAISAETYVRALKNIEQAQARTVQQDVTKEARKWPDTLRGIAGGVSTAASVMGTAFNLSRDNFQSTGEALQMVGSIASAIPGPWGQAAGAVLSAGGQLVDFFQRRLLRDQAAVREGFMSMASGAQTAAQAMSSLATGATTEGLQRIINLHQARERGFSPDPEVMGQMWAQMGLGNQPVNRQIVREAIENAQNRQRRFREVEQIPEAREFRRETATEQISNEMVTRAEEMPIRRLQRRLMRGMHAGGPGGQQVSEEEMMRLQEQLAIMRMIQQVRETDGHTIDEIEARERLQASGRMQRVREQTRVNLRNQRMDAAVEGMDTFARSLDEAANAMGRQNALFRTFQEGVDGSRDSLGQATTTNESLTRQEQIHTQVLARRDAMERLATANTDNLGAATRRKLQGIVAGTSARIEEMTVADRQLRQQELLRNAMQEGYQATQQLREPTRVYGDEINRLSALLSTYDPITRRAAISQETFRRGVEAANQAFRQADPTFRSYFAAVDQGVGLVQQFRDPLEAVREQVGQLGVALAQGRITNEEYETTLGRIQARADKANQSLAGITGTATGSAEAMARMSAQQERLRTPMLSVVTAEEGRQAVSAQVRRAREAAAPLTPEQMRRAGENIDNLNVQPREGIPIAARNAAPDFVRQNADALDRAARALERIAMTPQQRAERDIAQAIEDGIRQAFEIANFPGAGA